MCRSSSLVAHADEAENVLGLLGFDHVDHVVEGDATEQLVVLVDDRDRGEVVSGDQPSDLLLVHIG